MKRNLAVVLVVIAAITAMLLAGRILSQRGRPDARSAVLGDVRGAAAPDFELKSLAGKTVRLSDFRGKAVLLNFWATWCTPCKIEMPWFVELQKEYGPQGLQVLGVAMDDASQQEIAKFAQDLGVDYPVLLGKESVGDAYGGVQFLPTTFFIDREGKVVDRVFGLRSRSDFVDDIKKALAQPGVAEVR